MLKLLPVGGIQQEWIQDVGLAESCQQLYGNQELTAQCPLHRQSECLHPLQPLLSPKAQGHASLGRLCAYV